MNTQNMSMRSQALMEDMDRPGFFKDYYKNVRNATSNEVLKDFSKLKGDEERVRFIYEKVPCIHDIDIQTFYHGKSERDALDKKEAGNKAFGRKKNLEALRYYSQAVVKAPVLSGKYWKLIKENADARKMTLYPICLANRSAALYQLKDLYYCVKDIDEALEHHYPKELKYKLYRRKGRILIDLKRHLEARDAYRQAIKWLDWARMDRDKRMEVQKDIQRWLSIFESGKVVKNASLEEVNLYPKVPALADGHNPLFPALSNKIEVLYNPAQGRYAVAAQDIKVGEYLVHDKAYAAVLMWEEFGMHCQNCFLITKAPIPCPTCSGALFCSSECRDLSYFHKIECTIQDLLHGSGMSVNCFLALRMLTQTPIAFFIKHKDRLLVEETPEDILKQKPYGVANVTEVDTAEEEKAVTPEPVSAPLTETPENSCSDNNGNAGGDSIKTDNSDAQNGNTEDSNKENKVEVKSGKNAPPTEEEKRVDLEEHEARDKKLSALRLIEETKQQEEARQRIEEVRRKRTADLKEKEEMFWRIYHLVRHHNARTVEDFFHRAVMACFMVKALKKTKYFEEHKISGVGNEMRMTDNEALAGGLLLRFLQIIQFNAHEVSEFAVPAPKTIAGSKNMTLGAAIYPTLALFNHSCHSAQVRYNSGTSVITRAVRPISKGTLVPENYGPCYPTVARAERKRQLLDRYWFECQCEACTEDWPTFFNIDTNRLRFKCNKCKAALLVRLDSPSPFHACTSCGEQTNILGALKNLQNSEKTYNAALAEIKAKNLDKADALLVENMEQLTSALHPPFRDYQLTMEELMKCSLYTGNMRIMPTEEHLIAEEKVVQGPIVSGHK